MPKATHIKVELPVSHLKVDTAQSRMKDRVAGLQSQGNKPGVSPEVAFRIKFQIISNKIQMAPNLDQVLNNLKDEIVELFESERITIYVIDGVKRELVSRIVAGKNIHDIRVPVTATSIVGFATYKQRLVNIEDAYDPEELKAIDPNLAFDDSWDKTSGFTTRQVLACPIHFHKYLLGAIQLVNRKDNRPFTKMDEHFIRELAKILGIAMYNLKRAARQAGNKFYYLLQNHSLTQKELKNAIIEAKKRRESIESYLIGVLKIPKKEVIESLAKYYEVPGVLFDPNRPIPTSLMRKGKEAFMKKNLWVPLESDGGKVVIAVDNPHDIQKIDLIKQLYPNNPLDFRVALPGDIIDFIKHFSLEEVRNVGDIDDILHELQREAENDEETEEEFDESDSAVVKLVNKIIHDAYARKASDIHIEPYPGKQNTLVRIRIDGVCSVYQTIPYNYKRAVVSRIKIMAGLDIAERRMPQDGKIQFKKYGGLDIELRVATIPTQGSLEDIVMRILNAGEPIPLANMGFSERNFNRFVELITQPYGIIYVCGPTGSGKTTTLHSALAYINKTETKIWTAEDPVEITQKGLRQVQVHPKIGFNFATAMRAFLRADPDVIMVGEMRDKETTAIGIEASLTGHLVLSTLHTNSAPESITRLLDMGMDPFNFADAILGILAQRLVRTLCKNCKKTYHPTREEHEHLIERYGRYEFEVDFPDLLTYREDMTLYNAPGCIHCNQTGYAGRMAIHELLVATDEAKRMIQMQARLEELKDQAIKDGMRTLEQDGIKKIFDGFTDLKQVRKVCAA
ncbi:MULTISPECIES: GspE/PulE family protein [Desulfococcus]|jgi:type II secretory ATPase GspE/PulE/Tfp pilus assembly ATPase PilB-like protein|uniref:Putative phytochrome sensor protein n=1 Tax=Desulfococcus multivorans DSM 2059 TaxID=1121405 RepID=S7U6D1_DESML|nr:GspE/PulE family protein [Desulfococcus multivorans]AQV01327.1 pilus assembly protein [Desulfococcus multivorans]EPR44892.1 putative phytochrome sensor protein [Desulfococcus multivorans DSM 2059]MDX9817373.1 GspE/PulE family protein [Desulfococcus multivorans]SJZ82728.1 Type II secretory pathway ATPase GspE/PulE or T4P pilus assembly pathway ATPase PilB [Desulfococcus multivorans DSM 2059]